jgi:hypothetical protein
MTPDEMARAARNDPTDPVDAPYQPIPPTVFGALMATLPSALGTYTFIDLGSGKGRAVLLEHFLLTRAHSHS